MKCALHLLLLTVVIVSGCSGARLSHDEARRKIAEIGTSTLVPDAIEIRRIISQSDEQAVAETTVTLAFQFVRDNPAGPWRVGAVRLGDRDWISLDELTAAVSEARRRETEQSLQKLAAGIASYRERNGAAPVAADIVGLTDTLHPLYMSDLVRTDAWGHPIQYEGTGSNFRLTSPGADGVGGTADDVLLQQ